MTYNDIIAEVIRIRFRSSERAAAGFWVNQAYQQIWTMADWPWKRRGPVDLALTVGDATPALPSDFLRPYYVYDDNGNRLRAWNADEFDEAFLHATINGDQGRPDTYKWVDDTITLARTPDSDYTFKLVYEAKPSYLQGGTTVTVGQMSANTDTPVWGSEYHYVLVHGAVAIGLRTQNDPTYPAEDEIFMQQVASMRDHYLPSYASMEHLQYGNSWDEF